MAARVRNQYLHPNYRCEGKSLNSSLPNTTITRRHGSMSPRTRLFDHPFHLPPRSPLGLQEVVSYYTPGPTIIMIEKKKKHTWIQNKELRIACILLCAVGIISWLMSTYWSTEENFKLPVSHPNDHHKNQTDNLTGYDYILPHYKYAKVILSLDEDDESYVEDINIYPTFHY